MKVCTYMNLAAAAVLAALVSFPACNASTIQTTAVDEPKTPAAAPAGSDAPKADDTPAPPAESAPADSAASPAGSAEAAPAGGEADRSTDAIAAVIKDHRKEFRACYDKAQKEIPSLQGNLVLHFTLDGMGTVKNAELNIERSDIKSPKVVDCAVKLLKGLKFPPHPRGKDTVVNYPFNFRPH